MTKAIGLGDIARDTITGFEGTVIGRTRYINNCDRVHIQPKGANGGKPVDSRSFDVPQVEFVRKGELVPAAIDRGEHAADPVRLGDDVECRIKGVRGVVMSITEWMVGCSTMLVQPRKLKDGVPVDQQSADERDVKIIKRAHPTPKPVKTGAPSRPSSRRTGF
jgi:hypothetical protein